MTDTLWGQAQASSYLRATRIEVSNPLGGTPFITFYLDRQFLDADGNPVALVAAGSWMVTQEQAAADATLGPLSQTITTSLDTIAAYLYAMNNQTVN